MENQRRGFFTLETVDGPKTAHFSRRFITKLKDITGLDFVTWGLELEKLKEPVEQFDLIAKLWYAGLTANNERTREPIDYSEEDAADWLWDAVLEDPEISHDLFAALGAAMPSPSGKIKGKEKS